jgi:hypothetical protein
MRYSHVLTLRQTINPASLSPSSHCKSQQHLQLRVVATQETKKESTSPTFQVAPRYYIFIAKSISHDPWQAKKLRTIAWSPKK